ncbi:hypothetical protein BDN72DRAFT_855017 [Pluteus cervinus]|uniref:Uncharacterized protein n=1 Tax=Pluteus cervinus TaxID=181527 RepID=A0ACD3B4Y9_9AGAR|nr:hypothetical protein BDN72DRAFT_855017 [Pluteus cervinus]
MVSASTTVSVRIEKRSRVAAWVSGHKSEAGPGADAATAVGICESNSVEAGVVAACQCKPACGLFLLASDTQIIFVFAYMASRADIGRGGRPMRIGRTDPPVGIDAAGGINEDERLIVAAPPALVLVPGVYSNDAVEGDCGEDGDSTEHELATLVPSRDACEITSAISDAEFTSFRSGKAFGQNRKTRNVRRVVKVAAVGGEAEVETGWRRRQYGWSRWLAFMSPTSWATIGASKRAQFENFEDVVKHGGMKSTILRKPVNARNLGFCPGLWAGADWSTLDSLDHGEARKEVLRDSILCGTIRRTPPTHNLTTAGNATTKPQLPKLRAAVYDIGLDERWAILEKLERLKALSGRKCGG